MPSNKTPVNDGITKQFYVAFYQFIDKYFIASANYSFHVGDPSISQKQAVITLLEKKDRNKSFIKNWKPTSMLNLNAKIISEVLATQIEGYIIAADLDKAFYSVDHKFYYCGIGGLWLRT